MRTFKNIDDSIFNHQSHLQVTSIFYTDQLKYNIRKKNLTSPTKYKHGSIGTYFAQITLNLYIIFCSDTRLQQQ